MNAVDGLSIEQSVQYSFRHSAQDLGVDGAVLSPREYCIITKGKEKDQRTHKFVVSAANRLLVTIRTRAANEGDRVTTHGNFTSDTVEHVGNIVGLEIN